MDDQALNQTMALDPDTYDQRLKALDQRHAAAKQVEVAANDAVARAKSLAATIISDANKQAAATIMEAERRAAAAEIRAHAIRKDVAREAVDIVDGIVSDIEEVQAMRAEHVASCQKFQDVINKFGKDISLALTLKPRS
jgi:hypothetical protein